jgi:cytochrome c biogenesis protein CcmG, thiol:disulfide interchange protein DsbE
VNRFLLPLGIFVLLVVVLAVGIKRSPEKGTIESPLIGKPAPVWNLATLAEPKRTMSNAELRGKWYVVNIWGTWCAMCRVEHPFLMEMQRAGVMPIIGLNWKDNDELARDWLKQFGDPYDVVAMDYDGSEAINWGAYGAPETFLVNPEGVVVTKRVGIMTPEVWNDFLSHMPGAKADKS